MILLWVIVIGSLVCQPVAQTVAVLTNVTVFRVKVSVLFEILFGVGKTDFPRIDGFPFHADICQQSDLLSREFFFFPQSSLSCDPDTKIFAFRRPMVSRYAQVTMVFKILFRLRILLLPSLFHCGMEPIFPRHADGLQAADLVLRQTLAFSIADVDLPLLIEPFGEPNTVSFILRRDSQIAVLLVVRFCKCITHFPRVLRPLPNHTECIQFCPFFWRHFDLRLSGLVLDMPFQP